MSRIKPVFLIAGGMRRMPIRPDPIIQKVFQESGLESPSVAYIGTANGDAEDFFRYISSFLSEAGASSVSHVLITSEHADLDVAKDLLRMSDIVFISGGDVDEGIQILRDKKMVSFLRELCEEGKPFFGISAGSIMLAKEWVRWRDPEDNSTAELFPCLGFAPILCDTHGEEDDWAELRVAVKLAGEKKGYGIPSGTALKVYSNGKIEALGGPVHQLIQTGQSVRKVGDISPLWRL